MISFSAKKPVLLSVAVLILLLFYLLMKLPISIIFGDEMKASGITDIDGASLSSGSLWMSHDQVPGLIRVDYEWCPLRGLGSWCVQIDNEQISFSALATPRASSMRLEDAEIQRLSSALFGAAGGFVDAEIRGDIQALTISSFNCPMQHLSYLSAQLQMTRLNALGSTLGEHQLAARNTADGIEIQISGQTLEGVVMLNEGRYQASGELRSTPEIDTMARSLMTSLGGNRYSWEIAGQVPC